MKFLEIFHFELAYRIGRPSTWFYFLLFLGLTVLMVDGILVQEANGSGNTGKGYHVNAPFLITFAVIFLSMMGMVITAALFSDAAVRDIQTRMHPLFFTAPISKNDYLGGRFLGAFLVNFLLIATMPLGLILGLQMQSLAPELLGPFRLDAFLQPFLLIALPNLLVSAAILSASAALSRRALASYVGGLVLFLGSMLIAEALTEQSALRETAALFEPFGFLAVREQITYWTPVERNTQLVGMTGTLLWNRVIWCAGALSVFAFLYLRFRFSHEAEGGKRRKQATLPLAEVVVEHRPSLFVPDVVLRNSMGVRMLQLKAITWHSFKEVFANRYLLFIAAASLVIIFIAGWDSWIVMDTPTWPVTYVVAREVLGQLPPLIYLLAALFAGELVWREREVNLSELTDAMPVSNWVTMMGKFCALVLALIALQAVLIAGGIMLQTLQGYHAFEPLLYVQILFGIQLADYILWAALAFTIHVLVDQKHISYLLVVLYFVLFSFGRFLFGIEHNMLLYPAAPPWTYSDMSGFGPFLAPYLWFKLYWAAWALLFAVVASLFWKRGRESGLWDRFKRLRIRFNRPTALMLVVAVGLILVSGGFVFYNTNILHEYRPLDKRITLLADYERQYKQYQDAPLPRMAGSSYRVEVYPDKPAIEVKGSYLLRNKTAVAIDSVHLMIDPAVDVRAIRLDRPAKRVSDDKVHGYHILALEKGLEPGDSVRLSFDLWFETAGFTNAGAGHALVRNGTFLSHENLPVLGYQSERELRSSKARKEQGLPPRLSTSSIHDEEARSRNPRYSDWIHTETIIGTAPDQTAVAPGALRRRWSEGGRRYFHYATEAPIKNVYAFFSGSYEVLEDQWKGVQLQILYHPSHTYNLNMMVRSMKASLDYYTEQFGPSPYKQIRIVEFPRHKGNYARAFPSLVAYSEGFGFIARVEGGIDYPFAVTAHEVAHQWWGGQFSAADVQGRRVLHETLAHYSALMVMEKAYGPEQVRQLLGRHLHRYLVNRQNRGNEEVPLLLSGEDQNYLHYDKGAVAMYALREYVGEQQVNLALRRFLEQNSSSSAPYPTTLDLYQELQSVTPDSLHYLLTDLFEEITVWDMRTDLAQAEQTGLGAYQVTLKVDGAKLKADSMGRAQQVPMDDWVEIGLFATAKEEEELGEPLYLQKHRIRSGEQTITITVPKKPERAGIDPYHKLIEWIRTDNVVEIIAGKD